jgi:hypothetical protein
MEKIILVHYVGVGNRSINDIKEYLCKIATELLPKDDGVINYVIPTREETRIECLNPKLVSEEDYKQAKELLDRNQRIVDDIVKWKENL